MHPHGHHPRSHEGLAARLQSYEQRIRAFISQKVANIVQFAPISLATSNGLEDGLDGRPASQQSQRGARRVQHAGFRSRPPTNSQAVAIAVEGGATKLVVVAEDDGADVPLDEGEACVYSPAQIACRVFLDKNGKLTIADKDGATVVLDAGNIVVTPTAGHTIQLGGSSEQVVKGNTYTNAQSTLNASLSALVGHLATVATALAGEAALSSATHTDCTALNGQCSTTAGAISSFNSAVSTYLSTITKTG